MKYTGKHTKEISFPLGGIGTGSIGLGGDGRLVDWEIFNRPSKGSINGNSHFAIRAIDGEKITAAVLNGDLLKEYIGQYGKGLASYGSGPSMDKLAGFPHFRDTEFDGEFPIAKVNFKDADFPGVITMTAFNPFIPNDEYNSSIPGAFFEFEVLNPTDRDLVYQIAFSIVNPFEKSTNKSKTESGRTYLTLSNSGVDTSDTDYGDLTVATDCDEAFVQDYWYRGSWQNDIITYWSEFSGELNIRNRTYDTQGKKDVGSVYVQTQINAGEKRKIRFVLTWNIPNNYKYWDEPAENDRTPWKNYYATVFESSFHSAKYAMDNFDSLFERTLLFKNTLHQSTFPSEVTDAASANLSVLKSPTVLRLEDGSFYGWEGCAMNEGLCFGTCQHVYNYAYAMCFLFPNLEKSIRDNEFKYSTTPDGKMAFRMILPLGSGISDFRACLDGQMGSVVKCYREWKLSGNNDWLRENWSNIKSIMEYAWSDKNPDYWDFNKDGVLEGRQHHTLDMELFGPSSWLEGMYLLALKCASEMASFVGEEDKAKEYTEIFEKGKHWTKENLFNGEYFIHKVDITDKSEVDKYDAEKDYWNFEAGEIKYQIQDASSIDQALAQWHSNILGTGEIFDSNQLSTALNSMMKYNFVDNMRSIANPWRNFSFNDESGTIICAYPQGVKKPKIPIWYSEETMTGFEYAFAGLLCSVGRYEEGFKVVKAIRDRFDGEKRNPWNEFECGSNYARSMASYSLVPILSGFEFDMPNGHIGFKPYKDGEFSCIWSVAGSWGDLKINSSSMRLGVFEKPIILKSFAVKFVDEIKSLKIDGKDIDFEFKNGIIYFKEIKISKSLEIIL